MIDQSDNVIKLNSINRRMFILAAAKIAILGFKPETEKFADCTLKLYSQKVDELVSEKQARSQVVQNQSNFAENQENEGVKILDSGNSKISRRRPTQPSRPVGFKQEAAFHIPINPIFGPARRQIYKKCGF